jgi:DNA polymerase-1
MALADAIAKAAAAQPVEFKLPAIVPGLELHIDGDYAAYYCAGNDEVEPGMARQNTIGRFEGMARRCGASRIIVHLTKGSSHKGYRYFAATVKPYQAQRKSGRKPKNWQYLRDFLEQYQGDRFIVKIWEAREADDGIAICAYHAAARSKQIVIATADKDMRMLPGLHMSWVSQAIVADVPLHCYDLIGADDKQYGYKWLLLQLLHGDTADNIPGLEKVVIKGKAKQCGEVTAGGLLSDVDELDLPDSEKLLVGWNIVEDAYRSYYNMQWAERMAEQLCLLYLRHDPQAVPHSWTLNGALNGVADQALINAALGLTFRIKEESESLAKAQSI